MAPSIRPDYSGRSDACFVISSCVPFNASRSLLNRSVDSIVEIQKGFFNERTDENYCRRLNKNGQIAIAIKKHIMIIGMLLA